MPKRAISIQQARIFGAGIVILLLGVLAFMAWGPRPSASVWGPLAVSRDPLGGDFARTEGILQIGDVCVVVDRADGTSELLVWWRDQVQWNADGRRILLQNQDGTSVELADGLPIVAGGSGAVSLPILDWVAEPNSGCEVDSYWFVGDVQVASID